MRPTTLAKVLLTAGLLTQIPLALAQNVTFTVNTQTERKNISPLIYGFNAYADGSGRAGWDAHGGRASLESLNLTSRRLGGNNMTSYNWENGVSNSGADFCHSSNFGVTYSTGAGWPNQQNGLAYYTPGAGLVSFHDQSLALNTFSLLQLPAAGKLPKDIQFLNPPGNCNGQQLWQSTAGASNVDTARWLNIVNDKPAAAGALSLNPSLNDNVVYIDEELNFLIKKYGKASAAKGVKGYELDNEPDLWHLWPTYLGAGTHENLHPDMTTVAEVLQKNVSLAQTVKRMDASAKTFGPALSGYLGLYSLWSAWDGSAAHQPSDWGQYNKEPYTTKSTGDRYRYNNMTFANVYLDTMKQASTTAGKRLLDVFSFHYYPQASYDQATRSQASRSLWDPQYVEPTWITQPGYGFTDGKGLQMLPKLNRAIADFYPGTKLAVTEYDFGGMYDATGAIAQADALGAFGKNGVYLATYFGDVEGYIASAFRLFRNYDGNKSVFPEISVRAVSTNNANGTVYAAVSAADPNTVHLITINRLPTALNASVQITHPVALNYVQAWGVDSSSPNVTARQVQTTLNANKFSTALPPYSVMHFVLKP